MTMLMATGKQKEALGVFQSVLALTTSISSGIGLSIVALVWFLPFDRWLHLTSISHHDTKITILILALSVLLSMQETLFQGTFRCVGKYAYGTFLKSLIQLGSFCSVSAAVLMHGNVVQTAAAFCLANAAGTILLWIMLRRNVAWLRFGFKFADRATLKRLSSPAVAFMAFPIGNSLNLQGALMVVGYVLGPTAVTIFSTARTVSRTVIQFMEIINNSVWPEMSTAVGVGDFALARTLHRRSCQISIFTALSAIVVLAFLGPAIWKSWTMNKLATDSFLLDLLLFQVFFTSLWYTSSVVLVATNRHQRFAAFYLLATIMSLAVAIGLARFFGLDGIALALNFGAIFTAIYVLRASLHFLDDTFSGFALSMFSMPR
jgi:O-antigen/teichoic acid export membrane protein